LTHTEISPYTQIVTGQKPSSNFAELLYKYICVCTYIHIYSIH